MLGLRKRKRPVRKRTEPTGRRLEKTGPESPEGWIMPDLCAMARVVDAIIYLGSYWSPALCS